MIQTLCRWPVLILGAVAAIVGSGPGRVRADALDDRTPRLVIESGYHRSVIRELIFSADGRRLVSASDDKTIRIWSVDPEARSAKLARVLRGPSGPGPVGAIYAAALSPPDDLGRQKWLAVAGRLSDDPDRAGAIRIHDFATGEMLALLTGHGQVVNSLAFHPRGRWLASAGKDRRVKVWDMRQVLAPGAEPGPAWTGRHQGPVYDVAWSATGRRLASAAYNGRVGLWDTSRISQGQIASVRMLGESAAQLRSVAFHPDGDKLAAGGKDGRLSIWDAVDGKLLKAIDTGLGIAALVFSSRGDRLISGNNSLFDTPDRVAVFEFPALRQRNFLTRHDNAVIATAVAPGSRMAASGGGDAKQILLWDIDSLEVSANLQGGGKTVYAVGFAPDAKQLFWGWTQAYESHNRRGPLEHTFDLQQLQMALHQKNAAIRANDAAGSIRLVSGRSNPGLPYLDRLHVERKSGGGFQRRATLGRDLDNGYQHSAYSISADGRFIISGGLNGVLGLYTTQGDLRARLKGHEGEIKAVAFSADGQWALSGGFDQTLRLWRLDGVAAPGVSTIAPTLSIFATVDGQWIAWSPQGYYACSPEGSHLVGYRINQGADRLARYVSADQLYAGFYNQAVVWASVNGDPVDLLSSDRARLDAPSVLSAELPAPAVIIEPRGGLEVAGRKVKVKARVAPGPGKLSEVEWRVNGRPKFSPLDPQASTSPTTITRELELEPGANTIEVVTRSAGHQIDSQPAIIEIHSTAAPQAKPRLCMLSIGVDDYRHPRIKDLNYAVADAGEVLRAVHGVSTQKFDFISFELFNENATFRNIELKLRQISAQLTADDVFLLYLAGHGVTHDEKFYFYAHDTEPHGPGRFKHAVGPDQVRQWLDALKVFKMLVLIDSCQSGGFQLPALRRQAEKTAANKLGRYIGQHLIASSSYFQVAREGYKGHGVFTYALLEIIQRSGRAAIYKNREIKVYDVAAYVQEEVPKITLRKFQHAQKPYPVLIGDNFPIGKVPDHGS